MKKFLSLFVLQFVLLANTSSYGMFLEYQEDHRQIGIFRHITIDFRDIHSILPSQESIVKENKRRESKVSQNRATEYYRILDLDGNDNGEFLNSPQAETFGGWIDMTYALKGHFFGTLSFFGINDTSELDLERNCISILKTKKYLLDEVGPLTIHFEGNLKDIARKETREDLKGFNVAM